MPKLRTCVFDIAREHGYRTDSEIARAMGVSISTVHRVRHGIYGITPAFITGAFRAFPGKSFHDLFDVVDGADPEPISAQPTAATGERG